MIPRMSSEANVAQETLGERRDRWRLLNSKWQSLAPLVDRLATVMRDAWVRHRIFGALAPALNARDVRGTITAAAIANAVMAAVPGKLGAGVLVAMAVEVWMAWRIASLVGVQLRSPRDVLKYFGVLGGVAATILWVFRHLLNLAFAALSLLPALFPATAVAELLVTSLVGVLFWIGFEEASERDSFRVPSRAYRRIRREAVALVRFQTDLVRRLCSRDTLRRIGTRLTAFLRGDSIAPPGNVSDELFVAASMAVLVAREPNALNGPLGREFLQSIRDLYPDLAEASTEQIAGRMAAYDDAQMVGVLANIKGRFFERLVVASENANSDPWIAELHPDRMHPSTDMIISNAETGRVFAVSLKATDAPAYIEHTLRRYPDDRIWTTSEAAGSYDADPRVTDTGIEDAELEQVTRENFESILERTAPTAGDVAAHSTVGTTLGAAASLWPFVAAYRRGHIDAGQFERAAKRQIGAGAVAIAGRVGAALLMGPAIYPWFVLARACVGLTLAADGATQESAEPG